MRSAAEAGVPANWAGRIGASMWQLLRVRRARQAAVAAINPRVERSRAQLQGISDVTWQDPYVIGFLIMLITLIARRAEHRLGEQALGLVQLDAWEAITGTKTSNIGEEVCLLSANGDAAFQDGCVNAQRLFSAIEAEEGVHGAPSRGELDADAEVAARPSAALWNRYFDERIGGMPAWLSETA